MYLRKKYQLLFFVLVLCAVLSVTSAFAGDLEANKSIHRRLFEEVWSAGNLDVMDEIYAPGFVNHGAGTPDTESAKLMIAGYRAAFPDLLYTIEDQVAEGDLVSTRWTATGTHSGEFMGVPATGTQMTTVGMNISRIADGKIVESWNNANELGIMQQLGLFPAGGREYFGWFAQKEPSAGVSDPEANKAVVLRQMEEVWNQMALDVIDEIFVPGTTLIENIKRNVPAYHAAFPDLHITLEAQIAQDDMVITRHTVTGTQEGVYMGIPPTNITVTATGMAMFRVADGKIQQVWDLMDDLGVLQQLGVIPTPEPPSVTEANKAVRRRLYEEVWNQRNLDVIDEIYAPDYDWGIYGNAEGFKQYVTMMITAFSDLHLTIEEQIAEGDLVATRLTAAATHTGEFMGIPATGILGIRTGMSIARVVDGKIQEIWENYDDLGMMQQLGVLPAMGREDFSWGQPNIPGTGVGDPEVGKALHRRLFEEAWNQGKVDVIDEIYAPDFIGKLAPGGKEGFKLYIAANRAAFPDAHYAIEDQLAEGDMVVTRWIATGTHLGAFMGIPPSGVKAAMTGMSMGRIVNGRIAESWNSMDMLGMLQQIQQPPEPPEGYDNVFFMSLSPGLNMISLPLKPVTPYTARSLAEELSATMVIRYDEADGRFVGFTPNAPDDGFAIEGGKGYIVNVSEGGVIAFTGAAWTNQPPVAAPSAGSDSAWAFVVSGSVLDNDKNGNYTATVRNLRTGATAKTAVDSSGYFAAAYADLNRKAVVKAGDRVEIAVIDSSGQLTSGPYVQEITLDEIRNAVLNIGLRLGDVIPAESALLQNYPNPFNPETWIPYHLKDAADVSIRIYSASGHLVRILDMGHKDAGVYVSRSKTAYWDGRNETGEEAASGIYFYTITAGDLSATRKMVIKK